MITEDHGFIYKRDKLQESDKISQDKSSVSFVNKRFLLSEQPIVNDAMVSRAMAYLSKMNKLYVTNPMGVDSIKSQGDGQNYVHGGSSLQGMIVLVIANSTNTDPRHCLMREKFILKISNYTRGQDYYIVLVDMEDETKEHHRYKFEIDIAGIL